MMEDITLKNTETKNIFIQWVLDNKIEVIRHMSGYEIIAQYTLLKSCVLLVHGLEPGASFYIFKH